ncbi:hypothetical protein NLU13_4433 [Sarocladium strictum]|uniref:Protamine P1 n=1 Tax=Sarocladium strictum TaxID=5046 RepID=A0AA39L8N3_SARSR|nr:hypothetical protein NLU13_4433 [Sarocladium strictum]
MSTKHFEPDQIRPYWLEDTSHATHTDSSDIIYEGSDDEYYTSAEARQRACTLAGYRYLQGRAPLMLSTALRGPFDARAGWKNPWQSRHQPCLQENPNSQSPPRQLPLCHPTSTSCEAARSKRTKPEDSQESHLPSPESLKQVSVASTPHRFLGEGELGNLKRWMDDVCDEGTDRQTPKSLEASPSRERKSRGSEWIRKVTAKRQKTRQESGGTFTSPLNRVGGFSLSQPPRRGCRAAFDDPLKISFRSAPGKMAAASISQTSCESLKNDRTLAQIKGTRPLFLDLSQHQHEMKPMTEAEQGLTPTRCQGEETNDEPSQKHEAGIPSPSSPRSQRLATDAKMPNTGLEIPSELQRDTKVGLSVRRSRNRGHELSDDGGTDPRADPAGPQSNDYEAEKDNSDRAGVSTDSCGITEAHECKELLAVPPCEVEPPKASFKKEEESLDSSTVQEDVALDVLIQPQEATCLLPTGPMLVNPKVDTDEDLDEQAVIDAMIMDQLTQSVASVQAAQPEPLVSYTDEPMGSTDGQLGQDDHTHQCRINQRSSPLAVRSATMGYAESKGAPTVELNQQKHVNDAEINDAEINDAEINDAEINDAEINDAEINDADETESAPASQDHDELEEVEKSPSDAAADVPHFSFSASMSKLIPINASSILGPLRQNVQAVSITAHGDESEDAPLLQVGDRDHTKESIVSMSVAADIDVKSNSAGPGSGAWTDDTATCAKNPQRPNSLSDISSAAQSPQSESQEALRTAESSLNLFKTATTLDVSMASPGNGTKASTSTTALGDIESVSNAPLEAALEDETRLVPSQHTPHKVAVSSRLKTPEPCFSIKSMASFMSPSPQHKLPRRLAKSRGIAGRNGIIKPVLKCSWPVAGVKKRVTWASLPDERVYDRLEKLRQASPPPDCAVEVASREDARFQRHFTAVARRIETDGPADCEASLKSTSGAAKYEIANAVEPMNVEFQDNGARELAPGESQDIDMDREVSEESLDIVEDVFMEMSELLQTWDVEAELEAQRKRSTVVPAGSQCLF